MSATSLTESAAHLFATPEVRLDGPLKVTGRARYTGDVRLPGMLWAKFVLSPLPHARISSIDTSGARATPGIHAVLTGQDIGLRRFGRTLYDWPVLAYDRVLFVGERVAVVAAESAEVAEEAAARIEVEYEELPAVFDAEEALRDDAPVLHPEGASYFFRGKRPPMPHPNAQGYAFHQKGEPDIEGVFANAYRVFEDVYTGPRQHQGYIEPHGCVVWVDEADRIRVVTTNKSPFSLRQQIATATDTPLDQIVVDSQYIGGDFGGKGHSIEEFACVYLARAAGRPIRSIMSYADELGAAAPQHSAKYYLRTAVNREGRIIAHETRAFLNGGAYGAGRPNPQMTSHGGLGSLDVYSIPNTRLESTLVYTNLVPSGNMRAPGAFHRGLAGEGHIDHIARELGIDPLELRLRNALREGDTTILGEPVHNPRAVEVLETLRRETQWGEGPKAPGQGRGIALRHRHVGEGKTELLLRLAPRGRIEIIYGTPDQGGGSATVAQRVAAAALSVALDRISVRYGTTADARLDPGGAGGSRTTRVVGRAALAGAAILKAQLQDLAAEVMGWPAGEVRLDADRFVVGDGSVETTAFEEVLDRILVGGPVEAVGAYDSAEADEEGDYNFYAYVIDVEVDRETGRVHPREAVVVVDVGTIINPIAHQGQLDGGFVFGLGQALTEELIVDEDGRVTTLNLGDYKLPTQLDIPPLRTVLLPAAEGPGPFGAKAAGETTNTGVGGAIANAVYDAVGVRIMTAPITAERVFEALRLAERAGS